VKLHALRLPTAPPARQPAASSSAPAVTPVELLEKLQAPDGQKLLGELVTQLAPHTTTPDGFLEPWDAPQLADQFENAVVKNVYGQFTNNVREATVAALADVLLAATAGGAVDNAKLARNVGPQGVRFFDRLASVTSKSGDPLADRRLHEAMGRDDAAVMAATTSVAPPMAALTTIVKQVAKPNEFKGMQFMGLQHLFASSATMFNAIHDLGVAHSDMRFLGKVYSTNHRVMSELESKGAVVDGTSVRVGARDFADAMDDSISAQLRGLIATLPRPSVFTEHGPQFADRPTPRILLIDDGAEAIKVLHEQFPAYVPFFVCVEQTRRGARILHEMQERGELKCPVANVAETWAKLEWESPMIGHSVVLEVSRKLDRLEAAGVPAAQNSLVLGCGAVGGGVARAMLRRGSDVHLYDKDPARSAALKDAMVKEGLNAARIHVHVDKHAALAKGEVLVSCVGARTLEREDHAFLPNGAVLVNAASADDELGPQDLLAFPKRTSTIHDERGNMWGTFRGRPINLGKANAEAHSDAVVVRDGKEFYVVNNGYVVNMTGERDPIPPRYIQLTRSLLVLGAITAKRAADAGAGTDGGVGLHDVPREWQEALVHLVQRDLKKTGEDLKRPSWDEKSGDMHAAEEVLAPPEEVVARADDEASGRVPIESLVEARHNTIAFLPLPVLPTRPIGPILREQGNAIYGLKIGEAAPGSPEAQIAGQIEGGSTLSIDGAALYLAMTAVSRQHGLRLRASLRPEGKGTPFVDKSRVKFEPGAVVKAEGAPAPAHRFEALYGHFCAMFTRQSLQHTLKREPTLDEQAKSLKALFAENVVDARPWLRGLQYSANEADHALFKALRRA
jgi:S-adenosylhomocysteine hydrolase